MKELDMVTKVIRMMPLSFFGDKFLNKHNIVCSKLARAFFVWCRLHEGGPSDEL